MATKLYNSTKQKLATWLSAKVNTNRMSNQRGRDWIPNVTLIKDFNNIIESIRKDEESIKFIKDRMIKKKMQKKDAIGAVLDRHNLPRLFRPNRNQIAARIHLLLAHTYNTAKSIMEDRGAMMENYFWVITNLYRDVPNEFETKYFEYFVGDQSNSLYHKAKEAFDAQSQASLQHKFATFFDKLERLLKIKKDQEKEQESNLQDAGKEDLDNLGFDELLEEYREEPYKEEMWELIWDSFDKS